MAKKQGKRRHARPVERHRDRTPAKSRQQIKAPPLEDTFPSAATLLRFTIFDADSHGLLNAALGKFKPLLMLRDGKKIAQIKRAETAVELVDLAATATGAAEPAWHERVRQLDTAEIVPVIAQRLPALTKIRDRDEQDKLTEEYIGALRWHGAAGTTTLLQHFNGLHTYGQSVACVVLGLLGAEAAGDEIWRFYKEVVGKRQESYFVGALWGLIDLQDERAGQALADLLRKRRHFYELFGFLALAGDERAILPLVERLARAAEDERTNEMMALLSISHRIGREALIEVFAETSMTKEEAVTAADNILAQPAEAAEEYFALFFRSLTAEDLGRIL